MSSASSNSSSRHSSQEPSPKKTYRLMAWMALAAIGLLAVVIYSLSQLNSNVWTSSLKDLSLKPNLAQSLPHFEYSDESKERILKPESFAGHWTLLTFWAYWCGPCLEELPALNQLGMQDQGSEFEILTVNVDEPKSEGFEAARHFLSEQDISLATVFDKKGELKKAFAVEALPQHFLINPKMQIVWKATGSFKWNEPKARDQLMRAMAEEVQPEDSKEEPSPGSVPEPDPAK